MNFEFDPPLSRVHELGRMSTYALIATWNRLSEARHGSVTLTVAGLDRDRIIAAIRNLEDPR